MVGQARGQRRGSAQAVAERAVPAAGGRQREDRGNGRTRRVPMRRRRGAEGRGRVGHHGDGEGQIRGVAVAVRRRERVGGLRLRRGGRAGDRPAPGGDLAGADGCAGGVVAQPGGQCRRGPRGVAERAVPARGRRQRQLDRRIRHMDLVGDGGGAERRHVARNHDGEGQPPLVAVGVRGDQRVGRARAHRGRRPRDRAAPGRGHAAADLLAGRGVAQAVRQCRYRTQGVAERAVPAGRRRQVHGGDRHVLGVALRRHAGRTEGGHGVRAGDGEVEAGGEAVGVGRGQRIGGARQRRGRRAGDRAAAGRGHARADGGARRNVTQARGQRRRGAQAVGQRAAPRGRRQRLVDRGARGIAQGDRGRPAERRTGRSAAAVHPVAGRVGDGVAAETELRRAAAGPPEGGAVHPQRVRADADAVGILVSGRDLVLEIPRPGRGSERRGLARFGADAERQARRAARHVGGERDRDLDRLAGPVGVAVAGAAVDTDAADRRPRGNGAQAAVHLVGGGVGEGVAAEIEVRMDAVRAPHAAPGEFQRMRGDADAVRVPVSGHDRVAEVQAARRGGRQGGGARRRPDTERHAGGAARDDQPVESDPHDDRVARGVRVAPARRAGRDGDGGNFGCGRARHRQRKGERGGVAVRVARRQR